MDYTLKKSLGQHFLKDENVCLKIVDAIKEHSFTQLLEVGPGGGAITKYLLKIPGISFKAVELDNEKVTFLEKAFPLLRGNIINENFLEIDPPFADEFMVVGNFPYNISTQILFKVIEWKDKVPAVVGMFQKEVADRAASKAGRVNIKQIFNIVKCLYQYT